MKRAGWASRVLIVAPSSVVSPFELEQGVAVLESWGLEPTVSPQCRKKHLFYAGTDEVRVAAFADAAWSEDASIVWAARGGYGAAHLLPHLDRLTRERGQPAKKLFLGCSDSTALMAFVAERWKWKVIHAPMPGLRFAELSPREKKALKMCVTANGAGLEFAVRPVGQASVRTPLVGAIVGGNLSVLSAMLGTPYARRLWKDRFLFIEEVTETWSRVDKMVEQLTQHLESQKSKPLAIVLGNFFHCEDRVPKTRLTNGGSDVPIRARVSDRKAIAAIFGQMSERLGIPVMGGLPVGHGPGRMPLPFEVPARLTAKKLEIL